MNTETKETRSRLATMTHDEFIKSCRDCVERGRATIDRIREKRQQEEAKIAGGES